MELPGKKVIIFAEEMYNEFELWYPITRREPDDLPAFMRAVIAALKG
jgi:hypothetical protein